MSNVYFVDSRAVVESKARWYQPRLGAVSKLERLIEASGALDFIEEGDIVAIKSHFGVYGTSKALRSVFMRKVAKMVGDQGGRPFLTESCGLGMKHDRSHAVGRIVIAEENGYTQQTVAAPIIIADGMWGFDNLRTEIDGIELSEVYVAKAIAEADKVISLAHFKGHMEGGFGGAIKNLGVGCVAKRSKYDIHITGYPKIDMDKCNRCNECVKMCPAGAISEDIALDEGKCIKCNGCVEICEPRAISIRFNGPQETSNRIVDCAKGVIDEIGKENFYYFNFLMDITPACDCCPYSDNPIAPDIGILASNDPLAIDMASVDLVNASPSLPNSMAEGVNEKLGGMWETSPGFQLDAAERLKIGSKEYEIFRIE
ncbi:MAG: DUF362 domain-containing protein [Halobacteriota archaeon]|nr:DUF362 domain-containing protein [Halobacteriota archaeon]